DFDPQSDEWTSWLDFQNAVLRGVEANELVDGRGNKFANTFKIAVSDISAGDILAHTSHSMLGSRAGTWGHVQLVAESSLRSSTFEGPPGSGRATIFQGNITTHLRGSVPDPVQKGEYFFKGSDFKFKREGQSEQDGSALW